MVGRHLASLCRKSHLILISYVCKLKGAKILVVGPNGLKLILLRKCVLNFPSTWLTYGQWLFKQVNHGTYSNLDTQLESQNMDLSVVLNTDWTRDLDLSVAQANSWQFTKFLWDMHTIHCRDQRCHLHKHQVYSLYNKWSSRNISTYSIALREIALKKGGVTVSFTRGIFIVLIKIHKAQVLADNTYCAFHKHANSEVQKPTDVCIFRCCQSS